MAITTNVPPIQWLSTGIVLPTQAAILAGVQADLQAAFGGNLNPALNTPQGQLAQSLTAIIANANTQIANLVNGINPPTSSGTLQDAIGYLYYQTRLPALPTTISVNCIGAGCTIPIGAQIIDLNNNIWVCTAQISIALGGGTVATTFACATTGPIAAPSSVSIYQAITGWDSVASPSLVSLGQNVETPAAFEYRREQTIAANGQGFLQAVYGAVFSLPGITDCFAVENDTSSAITGAIGGNPNSTSYSVAANSIYVAVAGGTQAQIAQAIWTKKSPGCNTNGNTSTTIPDTNYSLPQPSYTVKYNTPTAVPIYFAVTLASNTGLPANYKTLIQNAIIAQFAGATGTTRARIGALLLASNYYGAVIGLGSLYQVSSVFIGTSASPTGTSTQMGIDQLPTIAASNISVSP